MKRNLKIFLLIAVCAITGLCMLHVREENKKQQIHSEKKRKGNAGIPYVQKRNAAYF